MVKIRNAFIIAVQNLLPILKVSLIAIIILKLQGNAKEDKTKIDSFSKLKVQTKISKLFSQNKNYIHSKVVSDKYYQSLSLTAGGPHPKSCQKAFRKLSRYESYKEFLSFVKKSEYNDDNQYVSFLFSSSFLPFDMSLEFKIPRIKRPGNYPFIFEKGFLKGLKGNIYVEEVKKQCVIFVTADWKGKKTTIPNLAFELFVDTLAHIAIKNLFRISSL